MKPYKSVELLSIFRMLSPPAQTQSPPTENFPATVLRLLLIHLLSTRSPILPKWNKRFNQSCQTYGPRAKSGPLRG